VKKGLASGRLPAAEAFPFVLGNPAVTSVVVGSLSLDHLREDLRIAEQVRTDWRPGTKCDLSRARKEAVSRERRP